MIIRPARPEDLAAVAAIEAESFSNPWHPHAFRSLLDRPGSLLLVAELPGEGVVGYTVLWWVREEGELANLAVAESHRGRGVGAALLDRILASAQAGGVEKIFLEVRVSNETARRLYRTRGFQEMAVRKDYYQRPREDALVLVLSRAAGGPGQKHM